MKLSTHSTKVGVGMSLASLEGLRVLRRSDLKCNFGAHVAGIVKDTVGDEFEGALNKSNWTIEYFSNRVIELFSLTDILGLLKTLGVRYPYLVVFSVFILLHKLDQEAWKFLELQA